MGGEDCAGDAAARDEDVEGGHGYLLRSSAVVIYKYTLETRSGGRPSIYMIPNPEAVKTEQCRGGLLFVGSEVVREINKPDPGSLKPEHENRRSRAGRESSKRKTKNIRDIILNYRRPKASMTRSKRGIG